MKKLFDAANGYIKTCDWKDMALIKFCLFSIGLMLGSFVSPKNKKTVFFLALAVFVATYIPSMTKFARFLIDKADADAITEEEMMLFADYIPE